MVDMVLRAQERLNEKVRRCNNMIISYHNQTISELKEQLALIVDEKQQQMIKLGIRAIELQKQEHFDKVCPRVDFDA